MLNGDTKLESHKKQKNTLCGKIASERENLDKIILKKKKKKNKGALQEQTSQFRVKIGKTGNPPQI